MKNLMDAMNAHGDGEETGIFNAEEYFAFGDNKKDDYSNPFSKDNIAKVEEELKVDSSGGAQSLNLMAVERMEIDNTVNITEPTGSISIDVEDEKLPDRTISTNNRFNSFESTSEIESPTVQIEIEDNDEEVILNTSFLGDSTLTEPTKELIKEPLLEGNSLPSKDIEELSKIAELKDSKEIARSLDSSAVEKTVLDQEIVFNIDEEEEDEIETHIQTEIDTRQNFYKEPVTHSQPTYTHPPVNEPNTQYQQQYQEPQYQQHESQTQSYNNNTVLDFDLFDSKFGPKYREIKEMVSNENIVDTKTFKEGSSVIGDVYVERAKISEYGEGKKRADYQFITANRVRITASQFNQPSELTNENIGQLIGKPLKIEGKWKTYRNKETIGVTKLSTTEDSTVEDYQETSTLDVYDQWYRKLASKIKTSWIRQLLEEIMINDGYLEKMKSKPASLSNHDNGKSGLFIHTMKVTVLSYQSSLLYPTVNTDVVIASGILHDIAKEHEIGDSTYTDLGSVTGHISLGYSIVREKLKDMASRGIPIDERVSLNILHCILAHHGKLEWGSPVQPKTREAFIIHLSDMLDTNVTHIDEQLQGGKSKQNSFMLKYDVLDLNIL